MVKNLFPWPNFSKPFNSFSIFCSSPWVKSLKVTLTLEIGRVKLNSFLPFTTLDSSNSLSSIWVKSTSADSSLFVLGFINLNL